MWQKTPELDFKTVTNVTVCKRFQRFDLEASWQTVWLSCGAALVYDEESSPSAHRLSWLNRNGHTYLDYTAGRKSILSEIGKCTGPREILRIYNTY